ncbi:hypothetical protein B7494_g6113 [Chlorociboria aeruginascens]|nr:hypothetical protein B7494_g6113 [Chlorociboria aeruginascens]
MSNPEVAPDPDPVSASTAPTTVDNTSVPDTRDSNGTDAAPAPSEDARNELDVGVNEESDVEVQVESSVKVGEENGMTKANSGEDQKNKAKKYDDGVLRTKAKIDLDDFSKNTKYDPTVLPETDDPKKIRAQVEFYFSDANLPTDRFMWDSTEGSTNLPIKVSSICRFGRMKRFKPYESIVAALRDSAFLDVIGDKGEEKVKRKEAYDPTNPRSKSESRSVYVKGFGDEEPSSQFDIEAFFAPYGPTNSVRLRRTVEKLFKGSVFVEFQDEETAKKFLELEPKPLWKGKHTLCITSKKAYMDKKEQEIKDGIIEPKESRGHTSRGRGQGRGRGRGFGGRGRGDNAGENRSRGDRDPDDWKKRRENDRASGFKDNRHRDGRDQGGRGRGRGNGRGRGRDHRNGDRNRERQQKNEDKADKAEKDVKSEPSAENDVRAEPEDKSEISPQTDQSIPSKKRGREDDNGEDQISAKKIATESNTSPAIKQSTTSESAPSKKRAREDSEEDGGPAKKIATETNSS